MVANRTLGIIKDGSIEPGMIRESESESEFSTATITSLLVGSGRLREAMSFDGEDDDAADDASFGGEDVASLVEGFPDFFVRGIIL